MGRIGRHLHAPRPGQSRTRLHERRRMGRREGSAGSIRARRDRLSDRQHDPGKQRVRISDLARGRERILLPRYGQPVRHLFSRYRFSVHMYRRHPGRTVRQRHSRGHARGTLRPPVRRAASRRPCRRRGTFQKDRAPGSPSDPRGSRCSAGFGSQRRLVCPRRQPDGDHAVAPVLR